MTTLLQSPTKSSVIENTTIKRIDKPNVIIINNVEVPLKDNLINATKLHKAAGYPSGKTAHNYPKLKETLHFIIHLIYKYQVFNLIESESGPTGGLYFHPRLAIKYAEYLGNGVDEQLKQLYPNYITSTPTLDERIHETLRQLHKLYYKKFCSVLDTLGATENTYIVVARLLGLKLYPSGNRKSVDDYTIDELEIKIQMITSLQRLYLAHKNVISGHEAIVDFAIDKLSIAP